MSDRLPNQDIEKLINKAQLTKVTENQSIPGCVALWVEETELEKLEISIDDNVRVKTAGDGPFICEYTYSSQTSINCQYLKKMLLNLQNHTIIIMG